MVVRDGVFVPVIAQGRALQLRHSLVGFLFRGAYIDFLMWSHKLGFTFPVATEWFHAESFYR